MTSYLNLFFPLQLDTLWGWWTLLSLIVILWSWLYGFVYFFFDSPREMDDEEMLHDLLVKQHSHAKKTWEDHKRVVEEYAEKQEYENPPEDTHDVWGDEISAPLVKKAFRTRSVFQFGKKKDTPEMVEETLISDDTIPEEVVEIMVEDIIPDSETIEEVVIPESSDTGEILMTEQKAKEIDNLTRATIQREEFESELNYLKKRSKPEDYEKKLIEWLAKDNDHIGIIEKLAHHYIEQNQHKKSLPLLKRILDKSPDDHKTLRQMADVYLTLTDVETSEVLIDRALSLSPQNPKYAIILVEIYYNTNRKDAAIDLMEQIVKRRPANIDYRETLAKLYEEMKDYDLAVECYQSILTINPNTLNIKRKLLEARTKMNS